MSVGEKTYDVTVVETSKYVVTVRAKSPRQAAKRAGELFEPQKHFVRVNDSEIGPDWDAGEGIERNDR